MPDNTEVASVEIVHLINDDEGITSCCGQTPFDLPRTDRITSNPALAHGCGKKKLYALMQPFARGGDYACALIEDTGEVLHEHISSSRTWGRQDLLAGLARKHDVASRYPRGYELVELSSWTDAPESVRKANEEWAASEDEGTTAE